MVVVEVMLPALFLSLRSLLESSLSGESDLSLLSLLLL